MATRGFENTTAADLLRGKVGRKSATLPQERSKYRNVKVVVGGEAFDSQAEAAYWMGLQAREHAGEIQGLRRQVPFPLYCPMRTSNRGGSILLAQVAEYVADFVFYEGLVQHVVDKKGKRTREYAMKKKWLELQDGIVIEEV